MKEWLEAQLEENPAYQELLEKMRQPLEHPGDFRPGAGKNV